MKSQLNPPFVASLHIYPIKSCTAIDVQKAYAGPRGFVIGNILDRGWMVIDSKGRFVSQREKNELARVKPKLSFSDEGKAVAVAITADDMPPLILDPAQVGDEQVNITIHGEPATGHLAAPEINKWFSIFSRDEVRLVYQKDKDVRLCHSRFSVEPGKDAVSFADGFPYLVVSADTLNKINAGLDVPVPMARFRPNIVVAGAGVDSEYVWRDVSFGAVDMQMVKPCARCVMTTIDQSTGAKAGKEPLATLARNYFMDHDFGDKRRQGAIFGQNAIALNHGDISVGDAVGLRTTAPPYNFRPARLA